MQEYDATCLVSKYNDLAATILIDQVQLNLFFIFFLKLPFWLYVVKLS